MGFPEPDEPAHQFDSPEEHREYIESKLITRKVIEAENKRSSRLSGVMEGLSNQNRAYSSFVAAIRPPSDLNIIFSPSSIRSASCPDFSVMDSDSSKDNELTGEGEEKCPEDLAEEGRALSMDSYNAKHRRKCNIVARSINSSIRSLSNASGQDNPTTCHICLLNYEVGEDVCWSPNEDCVHAYHKECIVPWLMNNPTCPECRRSYIPEINDEKDTTDHGDGGVETENATTNV